MTGSGGLNIRSSPRISVKLDVEYSIEGRYFKSEIQNLSLNGAYIKTLNPLPLKSHTRLTFFLGNAGRRIEAIGRVLYSVGYDLNLGIISHPVTQGKKIIAVPGMGVFFEEISESDKNAIKSFIDNY